MKYELRPTTQFKKDLKLAKKRGYDLTLLTDVIEKLANDIELPEKNHNHPLSGDYKGCMECHIEPDWLLVYEKSKKELFLYLIRTGTHSDLF